MKTDLDKDGVAKAYARWAPVYDLVFGPVFERGREAAIAAAERIGGRILEVGVDLSEPMLRKAQERVTELNLTHVEALAVMDAEHLAFPDGAFDVVVAQYVVSTVPNPEATLDEFARVLKPGGEIVLVSRVGADQGLRRVVEHCLTPMTHKLGWRLQFPWGRFVRWAERSQGMHLVERRPVPPLGHFSLIRFAKAEAGAVREEPVRARAAG